MVTTTKQWWLSYKLPEASSKVASILANKAAIEGFKKATTTTNGTGRTATTTTTYDDAYVAGEDTIYMRVC